MQRRITTHPKDDAVGKDCSSQEDSFSKGKSDNDKKRAPSHKGDLLMDATACP